MLPDRSKRYASADGEIPRERLSHNWQLVLLVGVVLVLFYLVFPQRDLLQRLYEHEQLDALSLSYLQNIWRADPRNPDVTLLMARQHVNELDPVELEALVQPYLDGDDARRRQMARRLLLQAYQRQLDAAVTPAARERLRARVAATLLPWAPDTLEPALAQGYAALAYRLGLMELGARLLARAGAVLGPADLERYGFEALGRQEYALASHYFLQAMARSRDRVAMRRYFQLGVGAWMAAGQPRTALETAQQHLGPLQGDLPTLRYLVKLALAAGEPALAAHYARQLVFVVPPAPPAP